MFLDIYNTRKSDERKKKEYIKIKNYIVLVSAKYWLAFTMVGGGRLRVMTLLHRLPFFVFGNINAFENIY